MKRFLLLLTVLSISLWGCNSAVITTRQQISAEQLHAAAALEIVSATNTVQRGETATVTVKGAPNSLCSIAVHLSSGVSKAKGLEPRETDENGIASWTWNISSQTKPGVYRITVTCRDQTADVYFTIE